MRRVKRMVGASLFVLACLLIGSVPAEGGAFGGPMSGATTIPAGGSIQVDVAFVMGEPALISTVGTGSTTVGLYVQDGDGHFWMGSGFMDRKAVVIDVYRSGVFRIELRNHGPVPNTVVLNVN